MRHTLLEDYNNTVKWLSRELSLPPGLIEKLYLAYWKQISVHMKNLPLEDIDS